MSERLVSEVWVKAALKALAAGGVGAVRVEALASTLGVTKGSFYWHFRDRAALLAAMLAAWRAIATEDVIQAAEASGSDPAGRLRSLFGIVFRADGRLERAVRAWGDADAAVASVVDTIDRERMAYVEAQFTSLGFSRREARARARFVYQALIGQFAMAGRGGRSADDSGALDLIFDMLVNPGSTQRSG